MEGDTDYGDEAVYSGMMRSYNLVESEIATDYAPIVCEQKIACVNGKVAYDSFSRPPAYIIGAFDRFGQKVKIRLYSDYFTVAKGEYTVRYAALPRTKTMEDECELAASITERTVAYGVAAEYCVQNSLYAEHAVWDKKYKEAVAAAYRLRPTKRIRSRRWM
jgi:hypothetical protein